MGRHAGVIDLYFYLVRAGTLPKWKKG